MFVIQLGLGAAELTKQATRKKQIAEIRDGTFARQRDKIAGAKSRKVAEVPRKCLRRRKKERVQEKNRKERGETDR